jgi:RNA polymerase sigma-70 factor (ECF subfamily)
MSSPIVDTDAEWVTAAYAAHGRELYRFAVRSLGDSGLAEEAVQTTYLRAWRASARYDESLGSLRTWLFAILRNVVVDMARARRVRPTLADPPAVEQAVERWPASESDVDRMLVAWQVEEALRRLSNDHRNSLIEIYFRCRSYEEVAIELGIPTGTVKSRVYYALKALGLALEELGWNGDE